MGWPALAPLLVLALVVGALRSGRRAGGPSLREDILLSFVVVSTVVALGTEALGAFELISRRSVFVFWLAAIVAAASAFAWRWRRHGPPRWPSVPALDGFDVAILAGIAILVLLVGIVASLAPPQSPDALNYHFGRVMHWIQNQSLSPYPTYDSRQLYHPPFAEIVQLHLYLLAGGDGAACLLQWIAMALSLLAASLVARDLGGERRAQILAAFLVVSLPIAITQATGAKNGWLEALLLLSLTVFSGAATSPVMRLPDAARSAAALAALGLGMMTKLTAWFFAGPIVVLAVVRAARTPGFAWRANVVPLALGSLLVGALTLPYLARNFAIYGGPVDPVARARSGVEHLSPAVVGSNALRNLFFQLGTPSESVNDAMQTFVLRAHAWIGADPFDERTSHPVPFLIAPPSRVEETTFSPLHILLVMATGIALLVSARLRGGAVRLPYLLAVAAGFVAFCSTVVFQAPNCRLLMPLLVLAMPLVSVVVMDWWARGAIAVLAVVLFLAALPYATGTQWRPLSLESGQGVLVTSRRDLLFARFPGHRQPFEDVAAAVRESGVTNLGVVFRHVSEPEYLLWVALGGPGAGVRVEHLGVSDASRRLASEPRWRDFRPELVAVFGSATKPFPYERELSPGGPKLRLVRRSDEVGFYVPSATAGTP